MTEQELIEALAEKEHDSWARWMAYVLECASAEFRSDGTTALVLPTVQVNQWRRQIAFPYADLPEQVKQLDRNEVAHILPIIREYKSVAYGNVERGDEP